MLRDGCTCRLHGTMNARNRLHHNGLNMRAGHAMHVSLDELEKWGYARWKVGILLWSAKTRAVCVALQTRTQFRLPPLPQAWESNISLPSSTLTVQHIHGWFQTNQHQGCLLHNSECECSNRISGICKTKKKNPWPTGLTRRVQYPNHWPRVCSMWSCQMGIHHGLGCPKPEAFIYVEMAEHGSIDARGTQAVY